MRLSEAILLGSVGTNQAFGEFLSVDRTSSCALGAACIAQGIETHRGATTFPYTQSRLHELADTWSILNMEAHIPDLTCVNRGVATGPWDVGNIIMFLNDNCKWTRPQIAAWVAQKEVELGLVPVEEKQMEHVG